MRNLLLRVFINHMPGFVFGVCFTLAMICVTNIKLGSTTVLIQSKEIISCQPIKRLSNNRYLVEIKQQYTINHPMVGTITVPHMIIMNAHDLEKF